MKTVFVCPFDLNRLTGTPIRTKVTIRAVATFSNVSVIATNGSMPATTCIGVGKCNIFTFSRRAIAILCKERLDAVHGITTISIIPMLLYKCIHPSVRLIFEMHGWAWFEQKNGGLFTRTALLILDLLGLWLADKVIVMSETQRAFVSRWTPRSSKIVAVWGPSEFETSFSEPPHRGALVVGYIGNAAWWQGLPVLIETAKMLRSDTRISFLLAGFDAGDAKQFPLLPNVSYVGRVERADVPDFLRSCDVLVSSRLKEGVSDLQYPQKLSEYLGAGRPVIVSAANDQPHILEKAQCGIVVDPMTPENLTEAIRTFARMSRQERGTLAERSLDFAEQYLVFNAFSKNIRLVYGI